MQNVLFKNAYNGKKVIVTGNTGFKGSWLSIWLSLLGAKVYGLSNDIPSKPSHFETASLDEHIIHNEIDIRCLYDVRELINEIEPDFVFHLAAQPIVRASYNDPVETIETNVIGTMNILEALRLSNHPCIAIMITSDKCYDNVEWVWGYRETDPLGGEDPYSASKGAAELIIKTYARSFFDKPNSNVKIASVRAGNVIGGGDWAKDRIVPDCIRAWGVKEKVQIRSPNATRPWQHVLEPLSGYLYLGQKLNEDKSLNGEPFNFGPATNQNYTVAELISKMQEYWEDAEIQIDTGNASKQKEANLLKLCCDKALHVLGWQATLDFEKTVKFTVDWYRSYYTTDTDIFELSCQQISDYVNFAMEQGQSWVKHND
ncbi:CDP-glucose 4,6-dehydratase [Methanococcoides burtonii]|uniref:Cytidine diphosphoglucose 4,6-dehydratase n=1 Tax=Methanococcoides burtonii (strain DSM 6242 / NBRC 107633 / OCM 468 / ACE-M) TaxID=259564 RepID=Q12VL9_METBU|nr:CDP-glucose 4,6-dehydratase [Methanococcoides burtonii]ABE52507.1 Cytidine diphosphoglucose 4,6-dehydratase [Methanococcoides burtonii DSM 6242]